LSVVQLLFEEGTEGYWARQRVQERLQTTQLPADAQPSLGPLATAYGEIYRYELITDGTLDLTELRTLNDWMVIPRLLRASGVAEVSTCGGFAKEYAVLFARADLRRSDVSAADVVEAIQSNNATAGGSVVRRGSMSYVVRARGAIQSAQDLESVFIKNIGGAPAFVGGVGPGGIEPPAPPGSLRPHNSLPRAAGSGVMLRVEETAC